MEVVPDEKEIVLNSLIISFLQHEESTTIVRLDFRKVLRTISSGSGAPSAL